LWWNELAHCNPESSQLIRNETVEKTLRNRPSASATGRERATSSSTCGTTKGF
jgi:hypothetical protein